MSFWTIFPRDGFLKGILKGMILASFVQTVDASDATKYIDPQVQMYVDDYKSIINNHCRIDQYFNPDAYIIIVKDIEQEGKDPKLTTVGQCMDLYPFRYIIEIDKTFFRSYPQNQIKSVVFHEMYHCIFLKDNKDHSKDADNYFNAVLPYISEEKTSKQATDDIIKACK